MRFNKHDSNNNNYINNPILRGPVRGRSSAGVVPARGPSPPQYFPDGRVPAGSGNGLGYGCDLGLSLLWPWLRGFLDLENSQFEQLLQLIRIILCKLEPFLRLLGLHDFVNKLISQFSGSSTAVFRISRPFSPDRYLNRRLQSPHYRL